MPRHAATPADTTLHEQPLVQRAVQRAVGKRTANAAEDVERIIEATYRVLAETGGMDPRMRSILAEAGLSTQAFYRHFASKDELLLVVLEDGRIRLASYLARRMSKVSPGLPRVQAWIEGMFAQATDATASTRTRPFVLNVYRLMERYPEEQRRSIALLVEQVQRSLDEAYEDGQLATHPAAGDATAIYHLTVGPMEAHIALGTKPARTEVRAVVDFAFRALGTLH